MIDVCRIPVNFEKFISDLNRIWKKITHWEAWPFNLLYAPMLPFWLYYILRSRAFWFFTPSNPKLTFGGMEGEPKREMYDLLPVHLFPTTINILPEYDFEKVIEMVKSSQIKFPLVVKPEVGGQGILFRKIDEESQLRNYHAKVPVEYIIQQMVSYPMEVSVFHIRYPDAPKGKITGFLHKIPLHVVGDGSSTLQQLIAAHPKAKKRQEALLQKNAAFLSQVIPAGEKFILSYAANHNRGAHFVDLKNHIDDKLLSVFDKLSHDVGDFYYGRYDIMCTNVEDLKNGINFSILEYNGCGAEPNHFYDTGYTLSGTYAEILSHWKDLYHISRINRKKGIKPWSFIKGYRFLGKTKKLYRIMREADGRMG